MDPTPSNTSATTPPDPVADPSPDPQPGLPNAELPPLPAATVTPDQIEREPAFVVPPGPPIRTRRRWRPIVVPIALFLVAVLGGGALFIGGFALGSQRATTAGTAADLQQEFAPFWEAWDAITQQYALGPVDRHALIEGAIGGLFKAVDDPYSGYMTSEEYKQSLEGVTGQFEGIGAEIGTQATDGSGSCTPISATCQMVVIAPLAGSPAEKAGLKAGDIVTAIDGSSTNDLTLDDAVAKVRGTRGTTVTLTIQREGEAQPIELTITRDVIVVQDVTSKTFENDTVGYLKIAHFSANVGKDFHAALQEQLGKGIKSFVLDLRGDPGGFVPEAVSVASEFIPAGKSIFWEEYAGGRQQETTATANGLATDLSIKLVVLVDKGSASAAEIVAAALQENGRAELVGDTTFGKGTVQIWQLLSQDAGGFRLTVAKWLTPDKNWIHGKGITPDVAVSTEGAAAGTDPILDKALEVLKTESAEALKVAA
jgi:carboxyl-terminal processing protease